MMNAHRSSRFRLAVLASVILAGAPTEAIGHRPAPPAKKASTHTSPVIDITGVARRAKGGPLVVLKEAVFYLAKTRRWRFPQLGKTVHVRGRLSRESYLPEARRVGGPNGPISQGVMPGSKQWVLRQAHQLKRPEGPAVLPFSMMERHRPYRRCLRAIRKALAGNKAGERAEEFYVGRGISRKGAEIIFPLWHLSALASKYRKTVGNPGGKNKNAACTPGTPPRVRFLGWQ